MPARAWSERNSIFPRRIRASTSPSTASRKRRPLIQASGRSRSVVWVALFLVSQWGCYGFAGGGLPPQIRTVAILPFDNQTSQPALSQAVSDALKDAIENRLGL